MCIFKGIFKDTQGNKVKQYEKRFKRQKCKKSV